MQASSPDPNGLLEAKPWAAAQLVLLPLSFQQMMVPRVATPCGFEIHAMRREPMTCVLLMDHGPCYCDYEEALRDPPVRQNGTLL